MIEQLSDPEGGVTAALTSTLVQLLLQLFASFDSVITPAFPAEDLSAQLLTYQVPADGNEYESVALFEPLVAASAALAYVPISVAPVPLKSVARWKRSVKPEPVAALPWLVIVAERVTGVPAVADEGLSVDEMRSGWVTTDLFALHEAVVPPPDPAQLHVHGPLPLTADGVPAVQSPELGAVATLVPFAEPQVPLTAAGVTTSPLPHDCVTLCAPDVTVTLPVLVPEVGYDFWTDAVDPESPSVPLHE
jgi:hypothetical protein